MNNYGVEVLDRKTGAAKLITISADSSDAAIEKAAEGGWVVGRVALIVPKQPEPTEERFPTTMTVEAKTPKRSLLVTVTLIASLIVLLAIIAIGVLFAAGVFVVASKIKAENAAALAIDPVVRSSHYDKFTGTTTEVLMVNWPGCSLNFVSSSTGSMRIEGVDGRYSKTVAEDEIETSIDKKPFNTILALNRVHDRDKWLAKITDPNVVASLRIYRSEVTLSDKQKAAITAFCKQNKIPETVPEVSSGTEKDPATGREKIYVTLGWANAALMFSCSQSKVTIAAKDSKSQGFVMERDIDMVVDSQFVEFTNAGEWIARMVGDGDVILRINDARVRVTEKQKKGVLGFIESIRKASK